jgi:hypothetical protein
MRERIERTIGACSAGGRRTALRSTGGVDKADDPESERGEPLRAGTEAKEVAEAVRQSPEQRLSDKRTDLVGCCWRSAAQPRLLEDRWGWRAR